MGNKPVNVVLCWHMHQPWYRESPDGSYRLPWVYLHALKDYSDMVAHLEAHPQMRAVVNFTPVLLEQLEEYVQELHGWLEHGRLMADPLLNYLAGARPIPLHQEEREELVRNCLRAHEPQMIEPHPAFTRLLQPIRRPGSGELDLCQLHYMNDQFFFDLLTWYHLVWLGHSVKRESLPSALMAKGGMFDEQDRRGLLRLFADLIGGLAPRYRKLAERGQVEISVTPYSHPIMPLLIDFGSMRCAMPEAPGPSYPGYPGGEERAHWHMSHGLEVFERFFGFRPTGVWLSEGSVSDEALAMLPQYGIRWTASGEGVWHNSSALCGMEHGSEQARTNLFRPHKLPHTETRMFFRDDGLSDMIGFDYQSWIAEDAAANFVNHLLNIRDSLGDAADQHVVSVILDGENAWEYYPDNAFHFLGALYERLVAAEHVRVATFNEVLDRCPSVGLPKLCAGSWVYGTFSTWIGEADKNRGWDRLVEAKRVYDEVIDSGSLDPAQAERARLQLAICEGSDWFWWFGGYNPADSVRDFDQLYRQQLKHLYRLLHRQTPANLNEPLSYGGGQAANSGTMRRGHE